MDDLWDGVKLMVGVSHAVLTGVSHTTYYRTGDQSANVSVTAGGGLSIGNGTAPNLVDGGFGDSSNDSLFFNSGLNVVGWYFLFDFGTPRIITEAKYYDANGSNPTGTWKWQGSNDGTSFVDIGSWFTLGDAAVQTFTQFNGNTMLFRYLRLAGVNGTSSSSSWRREIEFRY
ncbi:MAG TPA: hypothetical protein VNR11_21535 [Xanthobacteraceae bacterium]|nr:hypothetical protein [Xanthobacteraceae bacterium]